MVEGAGFIVLIVFSAVCLIALFLSLATLFPRVIERTQRTADESPARALIVGVVNLLFFGAIASGFAAVGGRLGANLFLLPSLAILALLGAGMLLGLTGMACLVGERLFRDDTKWRQTLWAGLILTLGSLTPIIGWFILFPYLASVGLGAFLLGWLRPAPKPIPASQTPERSPAEESIGD